MVKKHLKDARALRSGDLFCIAHQVTDLGGHENVLWWEDSSRLHLGTKVLAILLYRLLATLLPVGGWWREEPLWAFQVLFMRMSRALTPALL